MNIQTESLPTVRNLLFILFKHKIIIIICTISVVISVILLTANKPTLYETSTKLLLKPGRESVYRLSPAEGGGILRDAAKQERMNSELAILNGHDLIKSVIEDIGIENIYPWMQSNEKSNSKKTSAVPEQAIDILRMSIYAHPIKKSDILNISFRHQNPETAAKVLNTLVDNFLVEHLNIYQEPGELLFFEEQVKLYKDKLQNSENELEMFRKFNDVTQIISQQSDLLSRISAYKSRIADTNIEISELESKLQLLQEQEATGETSQMNLDAITSIRSKVTSLKLEQQSLLNIYSPTNIKIINIKNEIKAGEKLIKSEEKVFFRKEKIKMQNDLDAVNSRLSAEDKYLNIYRDELVKINKMELNLKNLVRTVKLDEINYELYASRTEEARISKKMDAQKFVNISIVDKAIPPTRPIPSTRRKSIYISIIMGLFLGIAVALIVEFNSHSFNNREDISKNLQLKSLASIPEFK
jgi:uncharacterized protein involved in exopolysaccharide biosynthesis